ncbi:tudor domain-containing protein 7A isoform X1 [Ostrinia furnacalis]|uniref:tudor domain-containing protein 7A isoform X1 n=1 Tax=Ostrinia furnacalis TaxID=93504 RepID=UPI00103E73D5|nr:tudor domain-containing protein 7A isoform X1 [Ostrinia furnacalis]XP_028156044.1 tudor domain-containing protein 7A isoform X1 [Ostrinia furnacalis]
MADKEQVIQALRATLISVKGALTVKQCNRDYRELQGEWIPFKKLGYPSLEKLFLDVPGFKVTQINGEWYVDAIASQETQHIAAMVARQKPSKKTNIKLTNPHRLPKKQGSWRKPFASSSYSYNYNNQYSNQYYRAKSAAPFNNNSYNNKYNNKYSYKTETKTAPQAKPVTRTVSEQQSDKTALNSAKSYNTAPGVREVNILSDEFKHSVRTENETDTKYSKISASQRLSNLRDRLSTVDLIPLQLPATKNECLEISGPVTSVTPAHNLEPPPDSSSSVLKLEWTCRKLGLPLPVYKVHNIRPKRGPVSYDCTVKVGTSYSSSSYPDSSPSEELAKEVAAVKMLAVIESSEAGGMPTSSSTDAIACLTELVSEHEAGLWASTVPHLYREKYGENLPSNWQELVENCPRIIKDRVVNGLLVLLPNNEEVVIPPQVESNISDDTIDSDLPPLQFPEEDFWNVFVTVANSTLEIWLRIIGPQYSDAFETLLADMAIYYERSGTPVDKSMLIKNAWYAVNLDDGGWQRAKIMDIDEDKATVFLGDHGDDDIVNIHKIKILEPQFRRLPAQAILCRLEGAEELAASAAGAALVQRRLPGEVLVAAPGPRADPADPSVALVLYDTSTQRDLNLNKEIVQDFCIAGAFNLTQALPARDIKDKTSAEKEDPEPNQAPVVRNINQEIIQEFCIACTLNVTQKPCEVEVGCVSEEGRVWVSRAGGAVLVRDALALLTAGPYRRPLPAAPHAPSPNAQTLYIVRTLAGDWVRCTIISGLDGEGTVRTQLVDSGLILRAPLSSLVPLQTFSPALNAFPWQAMQVRLGAAERAVGGMVGRLRELLLGARVLCRALPAPAPAPAPSPPHVELFVRTGPQNILASVNNAILMEFEYLQLGKSQDEEKDATNHVEALHKKKERIFRSLSAAGALDAPASALPPPALPAPGKCFDVYIAMAANPWNFVVQPNSTRHTLQTMMSSLQAECPKLSEADSPTNPVSGELYTVYYDKDASWYRVTIAGAVSTEMVSVYFCDYGDLALFPTKSLRPVPSAAPLARSLPPQAIKARLYDVWPLHQDWTVEDCIRFQELCVEQQFVGICKEVGKDPLNPNEPLLTLDLIDTSTDEDIYLNKQLVAECRARLASSSTSS